MAARVRSVKCLGKLEKPRPRKVSSVTEPNVPEENPVEDRKENEKSVVSRKENVEDKNGNTKMSEEDPKTVGAKHPRSIRCRGKLEKPRPRHVLPQPDVIPTSAQQTPNDVSSMLPAICKKLDNGNIIALYHLLLQHGRQLETAAPEILNDAYNTVRSLFCEENGTSVDWTPEAHACLLQIMELRASKWHLSPCVELYYKQKQNGCSLNSEVIHNNQSFLQQISSQNKSAEKPDILCTQAEVLQAHQNFEKTVPVIGQNNVKPVPVTRQNIVKPVPLLTTQQDPVFDESESGSGSSSPDNVETTNELYRSIIMAKMSSVDEHDHRADNHIEVPHQGEGASNGMSIGDSATSGTSEHKANVRRELTETKEQQKYNAVRNEKRNRTVFSIDKWDATILENPKVYGFIAMVTDTTITRMPDTIDKDLCLFDIRGATKDRNKAIRLIAERCDIVKNPDKYWHEMYPEQTAQQDVQRRSSTPSKDSDASLKTMDSESHSSTTNPRRVFFGRSVSQPNDRSAASVSHVAPKAEESREINNNDSSSSKLSGWEQTPGTQLSRLRRATTNVPIAIPQTAMENVPRRSRSLSCEESLNVGQLTNFRRVEFQAPSGWEETDGVDLHSEAQNNTSGWEGGEGFALNGKAPSEKDVSGVEEDCGVDMNISQRSDASGWEGGDNCDIDLQVAWESDKSGWKVTFTTLEDASDWKKSEEFTVDPKNLDADSGVEGQNLVSEAEVGEGEASGAMCSSPHSSLEDVWDDDYEQELAKALEETNTQQKSSTSETESWILPGHGWDLPDMSRPPPSLHHVDMKEDENQDCGSFKTVDRSRQLSGPISVRKGFGTLGSERYRRSSCSSVSNLSDHERANPKTFKRNMSETYGPYGETAHLWGSSKLPVHGQLGYLQPANILREPLHPMSSLRDLNRAERGQPIGGHSAVNRRKKFAVAAARRLTSLHGIKDRADGRIEYTREFLLACAVLPSSRHPPPNWAHFVSQFPVVCIPEMAL